MCILFIYTDPAPQKGRYRLIIASNRDEYYQRPARSAYLCSQSNIIGGRDMESGREGGMWLGASVNNTSDYRFRFGCLLNVTGEKHRPEAEGRGFIVVDYLKDKLTAKDYTAELSERAGNHNAFNFVAVELSKDDSLAYFLSNSPNNCQHFDGRQVLGFGNSPITSPLTKVKNGTDKFADVVQSHNDTTNRDRLVENLLELLKWKEKHLPDEELRKRSPSGFEYLSSVYVKVDVAGYGTRTHSIILIDYDWNLEFVESTMEEPIDIGNPTWKTRDIRAHL